MFAKKTPENRRVILSEADKKNLNALVSWLQTFPQFADYFDDFQEDNFASLLEELTAASAIYHITEEVCGEVKNDSVKTTLLSDTEGVWGMTFQRLTSPLMMQRLTGKRISKTQLRVLLLSELLCRAIAENCAQRRTYIGRIIGLPQNVQLVLRDIIEQTSKQSKDDSKNSKTVAQMTPKEKHLHTCETPRSSGSRKVLERSNSEASLSTMTASTSVESTPQRQQRKRTSLIPRSATAPKSRDGYTTPGNRRTIRATPTTTPQTDLRTRKDLLALMAWIGTFPTMEANGAMTDVVELCNMDVARTILGLVKEICDHNASEGEFRTVEDVWTVMQSVLSTRVSSVIQSSISSSMSLQRRQLGILSAVLCFVALGPCEERNVYMGRILSLSTHVQHRLMHVIEKHRPAMMQTSQKIARLGATPRELRQQPPSSSVRSSNTHPNPTESDGKNESPSSTPDFGKTRRSHDEESVMNRNEGHYNPPITPVSSRATRNRGDVSPFDTDESRGSRRSLYEAFGTPEPRHNGRKKSHSILNRGSGESLLPPGRGDPALERLVGDLRRKNETLKRELEASQKRESDVITRNQDMEAQFRKEMIKLESVSSRQLEEIRTTQEETIASLQSEMNELRDIRDKEEKAQRELSALKDDVDLLQHTQEKLAETEEKFRKCRERLEQLSDLKDSLKREEEAHSASVSECLRMENELKSLQPLRRQLEEYKSRAVEAEVKLAESQEDLKKMASISQNLNSAHKHLLRGARMHQEEADELRRRLCADEGIDAGPNIAEGISELNPQVKAELSRLRNENDRLRVFANKRENDEVQKLEERLDDSQRLAERFKDQFLTTKEELEKSQDELVKSNRREDNLRGDVAQWTSKWEEMDQTAQKLGEALDATSTKLEETTTSLQESEKREADLRDDVASWTSKANDAESLAKERLEELDATKIELKEMLSSLTVSQERGEKLVLEIEDISEKLEQTETSLLEYEELLETTRQSLHATESTLEKSKAEVSSLNGVLDDARKHSDALEVQLAKQKKSNEDARDEASKTLETTQQSLEAKHSHEMDDLQRNMNMLLSDERKAYRNQLSKAADEYEQLLKKTKEEYSRLKEQMAESVKAAKLNAEERVKKAEEKCTQELEQAQKDAETEKENLVRKGKGMMKDAKVKAENTIQKLEDQLGELEHQLETSLNEKDELEQRSRTKVSSLKQKLQVSQTHINQLRQENDDLEDCVTKAEREKRELLEENDLYRRRLGGRYGADGKVQSQLEMLQKEFNAVLDENRELKKRAASNNNNNNREQDLLPLPMIPESSGTIVEAGSGRPSSYYARGGVGEGTLSALREEYEEQLQALIDEKRELVMRNSVAMNDVQKAEQRAWELEKELANMREELTTTRLDLQRAEVRTYDDLPQHHSQHYHHHNQENSRTLLLGVDTSMDATDVPRSSEQRLILSPTNRHNKRVAFSDDVMTKVFHKNSGGNSNMYFEQDSTEVGSLIDLTSTAGVADECQQECKQS